MRRVIFTLVLMGLLVGVLEHTFYVQEGGAEPATLVVPNDYSTIQAAINAANPGDTIFVLNGTYYEHVIVNKTISLIGQNKTTTVVDGQGNGTVIHAFVDNVVISGFTIRNSGERFVYGEPALWCGVMGGGYETYFQNFTVVDNIIEDNYIGIFVWSSWNGSLVGNMLVNNTWGIASQACIGGNFEHNNVSDNSVGMILSCTLFTNVSCNIVSSNELVALSIDDSYDNVIDGNCVEKSFWGIDVSESREIALRRNDMVDNQHGFGVIGNSVSSYIHDIDTSNTIDGKPIYYLINQSDFTVNPSTFPDVGYLGIVNSSRVAIRDLNFTHNIQGILLAGATDCLVTNVSSCNNNYGLHLAFSHNNTISDVTAANSVEYSIYLEESHNNTISHVNFINNTEQINLYRSFDNKWNIDYPYGGNYWSNYGGKDLRSGRYQNETGSDGIGDTPYIIDGSNCDMYPLMGYFGPLTMKGENATVFPTDDVNLIFERVATRGSTTVNKTDAGPSLPAGFQLLGKYYDVKTTASHFGKIRTRIIYDHSDTNPAEEEELQLMQWNEVKQLWETRTTRVDTESHVIYGETWHLSIFGVTRRTTPIMLANVSFSPGAVNLKSTSHWMNAFIELPLAYNASDINFASIMLNHTIPADLTASPVVGDFDDNNVPDLMVTFNRTLVLEYILSKNITDGHASLSLTGELSNVAVFEGINIIAVSSLLGDVDGDGSVAIIDIVIVSASYGSLEGEPRWNPNANFAPSWRVIDIYDIVTIACHYGETNP